MSVKLQEDFDYDHDQKYDRMVGFVDLGLGDGDDDGTEEAKEALVFMVVGITVNWRVPMAYFFTKILKAPAQHQLVLNALDHLYTYIGVRTHVVTMDGHATNVKMCRLLGCSIDKPHNSLKSVLGIHTQNMKCSLCLVLATC